MAALNTVTHVTGQTAEEDVRDLLPELTAGADLRMAGRFTRVSVS